MSTTVFYIVAVTGFGVAPMSGVVSEAGKPARVIVNDVDVGALTNEGVYFVIDWTKVNEQAHRPGVGHSAGDVEVCFCFVDDNDNEATCECVDVVEACA